MYKKLRSLRRGCALLLTLVLCAGLLQLPALAAEGDCKLGQDELCICAEDACLEDCPVCHPLQENEEDPDAAGEVIPLWPKRLRLP